MARLVDSTNYIGVEAGARPWWTSAGTVVACASTTWASGDNTNHMLAILKNAGSTEFFIFYKTDTNLISIGWYTSGGDGRLGWPDAGWFNPAFGMRCHLYDWDDATNTQHYYIDNTLVVSGAPAFTVPSGNADAYTIGGSGGAGYGWDGAIAEMGRWNRVLTDDERDIVMQTGCPLSVPRGLVSYFPLIGRSSPEPDLMGGPVLPLIGAPSAAAHSRVFYSAAPYHCVVTPAAPPEGEIAPPLVSNTFQIFAPAVSAEAPFGIAPPVVANPFQLFAPSLSFTGEQSVAAPLISSPFTVYAPAVHLQESTIQEDTRELEPHNLKVRIVDFVGGDDLRITRTYTGLQGGITISKGYLTIKRRAKDDTDAEAVVQKMITTAEQASGMIQDDDTTGGSIQMYFDLSNSDTSLLTPLIPYHYDVQVHTIGNAIYTCEKGVIVMHQGVTDSTS